MLINIKKQRLSEIESKMSLNQSLFSITNMFREKSIYEELRKPIIDKDEKGNIMHMSIDCNHILKQEFILYKKYKKEKKEYSILDIVIKSKKIKNMNTQERVKYLSKIYRKSKKYNLKVFIYELDNKKEWNELWLDIITVFDKHPISRYF